MFPLGLGWGIDLRHTIVATRHPSFCLRVLSVGSYYRGGFSVNRAEALLSPPSSPVCPCRHLRSPQVISFVCPSPLFAAGQLLNRRTSITSLISLISRLTFCRWARLLKRMPANASEHKRARGKVFHHRRCDPENQRGEALSKTEGSQSVDVLSNKLEGHKHDPPSVWLPSSQQDIKYSISAPSPLMGGVKSDSINALYC